MSNFLKKLPLAVVITMVVFGFPTAAKAFSFYYEDVDGDLSNDGLNPTQLGKLTPGRNTLKATFNAGGEAPDPDYFTFIIPKGQVLNKIRLRSWKTSPFFEDIAFIGIQKGKVFDFVFPNENQNPAEGLLGWSHLRSTQVGTNKILKEMSVSDQPPEESGLDLVYEEEANSDPYTPEQIANLPPGVTQQDLEDNLRNLADQWAPGAKGFDLPLGPGKYSFWLRQGSEIKITTKIDFETVPEPLTILGTGVALGFGILFKRRSRTRR